MRTMQILRGTHSILVRTAYPTDSVLSWQPIGQSDMTFRLNSRKSYYADYYQLGHCRITHHLRFYVAPLRETFFCLSRNVACQLVAKIFCLTQRRNVKSKAESKRPTISWPD